VLSASIVNQSVSQQNSAVFSLLFAHSPYWSHTPNGCRLLRCVNQVPDPLDMHFFRTCLCWAQGDCRQYRQLRGKNWALLSEDSVSYCVSVRVVWISHTICWSLSAELMFPSDTQFMVLSPRAVSAVSTVHSVLWSPVPLSLWVARQVPVLQ
jgi:hypothetical protein